MPTGRRAGRSPLALVVLAALVVAPPVGAQSEIRRPPPRPEVRADYLDPLTAHAGAGVNVPLGTYVRLGLIGGAGTSWRHGAPATSARADVVARFAFDPFRERRWGPSAGGGLSVRYDHDPDESGRLRGRWRTFIAVFLDLEGRRVGSLAPAVQLGLGGGLRVGLIVRAAAAYRR